MRNNKYPQAKLVDIYFFRKPRVLPVDFYYESKTLDLLTIGRTTKDFSIMGGFFCAKCCHKKDDY